MMSFRKHCLLKDRPSHLFSNCQTIIRRFVRLIIMLNSIRILRKTPGLPITRNVLTFNNQVKQVRTSFHFPIKRVEKTTGLKTP